LVVVIITRIKAAHRKPCPALPLQHLPAQPSRCSEDDIPRSSGNLLLSGPPLSPIPSGEQLLSYKHTKNFEHKQDAATATFVTNKNLLAFYALT
jgi:hypothetical protein